MNRKSSFLVAAALLAVSSTAQAQLVPVPRALGMAGAYHASARGAENAFFNPARLAWTSGWSVALPMIGLGETAEGLEATDLIDLFSKNSDLPQARKDEILASIPAAGTDVGVEIRPAFALQIGKFALGVSHTVLAEQNVGRDIVDLMLNGYEEDRFDYSIDGTSTTASRVTDVSLSYGREFKGFAIGAAAHYFKGSGLHRARVFEPTYDFTTEDISVAMVEVSSPSGTGFGLDLGAALERPKYSASVTVANAFSSMKWDEDLMSRSIVLNGDDVDDFDVDAIRERWDASQTSVDANNANLQVVTAAQGLYDEAYFPTTLRAGLAYRVASATELAVGFHTEIGEGRLSGWWDKLASVGVQQKVAFLGLRAGAGTNFDGGSVLSGGVSLGPIEAGVARIDRGGPTSRPGYSASVGLLFNMK